MCLLGPDVSSDSLLPQLREELQGGIAVALDAPNGGHLAPAAGGHDLALEMVLKKELVD